MLKPSRLAIVKCQAHRKGNDFVIVGNNKTDEMARQASGSKTAHIAPVVTVHSQPSLEDIKEMQGEAPAEEKTEWERRGAKQGEDEIWRSAEGMPVALLFFPSFEIFSQQSYRYPVGLLQCERPSGQTGAGPPDWRDTPHYRSPRDPRPRMPSRSQYENLLLDRLGPLLDDASDQAHESYC